MRILRNDPPELRDARAAVKRLTEAAMAGLGRYPICPNTPADECATHEAELAAWEAELARRQAELEATAAYQAAIARVRELEAREERQERIRDLEARGVPRKDVTAIVDGQLDDTEALVAARSWELDATLHLLLLLGRPGAGKTTAAGWLCRERGRMITAPAMARMSAYDRHGVVTLESEPLLVIDDVGTEYADKGGLYASMLDTVVNARYASQLPTVATTNLTVAAWRTRYGDRILDRVRECGQAVALTSPSLRGRG